MEDKPENSGEDQAHGPGGARSWGQPACARGSPVTATLPGGRWTRTSQLPMKAFTLVTLCDLSLG